MDYDKDDYDDCEPNTFTPVQIPKLRTLGADGQSALPDKPQIVEGLLKAGDIACIYGQPGVGKSVLAPYLGYCIALGRPFFGHSTKAGKVLYVATEDAGGIEWRRRVMESTIRSTSDFKITAEIYDLYEPSKIDRYSYSNIIQLSTFICDEDISVIIIDTLSRAFPGLDENNHRSMGQLIDNVERIAAVRDTAVVLVHHDSKADTGRPRGHGSFWARLDTAIYLQRRRSGFVNCRVEKNKTRQSGEIFKFAIEVAQAGFDSGLDAVTAPVLREMADGPNEDKGSKASSKAELVALQILIELQESGPVHEREWLSACAAGNRVSGSAVLTSRVRVTRRVIQNMKEQGLVLTADGFVSPALPSQ